MARLVVAVVLLLLGCDCGGPTRGAAPTPGAGDVAPDAEALEPPESRASSSAPEAGALPATRPAPETGLDREARRRMVETQLAGRDIADRRLLAAMGRVPRHRFVPPQLRGEAYADYPLPIGLDQTISQPYVVAFMTQALRLEGRERVLEIGTGSGYQAAILAELCREVFTIEIIPELAARARVLLDELGYTNVHVRAGDGYRGWPEEAPFDGIIVTAAPDHVPQPLVDQLAQCGRMIIPVGAFDQDLLLLERGPRGVSRRSVLPVRFVPMTGEAERRR